MAGIKHTKVATFDDDPTKEVNKGEWNAEHNIDDAGIPVAKLSGHDKTLHDALGVDAATLGGSTKAQVQTHAPASHGNEVHSSTFITQGAVDAHKDLTTGVHGAGASTLETIAGSQGKVDAHKDLTTGVHGVGAGTVAKVSDVAVDANLSTNAQDAVSKRHTQNADTDLDATFEATFEKNANKGAVSGYAPLDAAQKVPTVNLGGAGADNTKFLRGDQTWQVPAGGGESETIARVTGDITNNTTTFADITGLTFSMDANGEYIFEAWLIFQSDTTGTGLKVAANSAVAANDIVLLAHIPIALTLYASCVTLAARAYNTGTPSVSVDAINSNLLCKIDGIVRNGANAGTFALRFAAETTGIVKIKTGSVLRYRKTY